MLHHCYVILFQRVVLAMKCVVQEKLVKMIVAWPVCIFIHIVFKQCFDKTWTLDCVNIVDNNAWH